MRFARRIVCISFVFYLKEGPKFSRRASRGSPGSGIFFFFRILLSIKSGISYKKDSRIQVHSKIFFSFKSFFDSNPAGPEAVQKLIRKKISARNHHLNGNRFYVFGSGKGYSLFPNALYAAARYGMYAGFVAPVTGVAARAPCWRFPNCDCFAAFRPDPAGSGAGAFFCGCWAALESPQALT